MVNTLVGIVIIHTGIEIPNFVIFPVIVYFAVFSFSVNFGKFTEKSMRHYINTGRCPLWVECKTNLTINCNMNLVTTVFIQPLSY